jgi:sortase A
MLGIAGHRTTYGAPFRRVDQLHGGDSILVEYRGHRYTYQVSGRKTVRPQQVDVLQQEGGRQGIALVTCSPPYSAAFRLVVFGRLQRVTELVGQ